MDALLKKELSTEKLKSHGYGGGGDISSGQGYDTDHGTVFVKSNNKKGSMTMFEGEMASLEAICRTNIVKAPKPLKVIELPNSGAALAMEFLDLGSLRKYSSRLGEELAKLHLHNREMLQRRDQQRSSVHSSSDDSVIIEEFGFHKPTCCGFIPQENTWDKDWVTFYSRYKLQSQLDMIEKEYGDREARELWTHLIDKIPKFFKDVDVFPSLLHGDLWGGNAGELSDGPVIYDPASFYGHSEYDLGIAKMFGGFGSGFFSAYHKVIPKDKGFDDRIELYQLFHYLNHWNHFGGGYRGQSLSIMRRLAKS